MNFGMKGNLALTDVIRLNGDQLVTYLHPSISVDDALGKFSANNHSRMDMRLDIISFGFHAWGGYNTFNIGVRANAGFNAPYELFEFTKNLTNKNYEITDVSSTASAWGEIALGHSRQVADAWRVGGKLKFLIGGANASVRLKNATLNLTAPDKWVLSADARR